MNEQMDGQMDVLVVLSNNAAQELVMKRGGLLALMVVVGFWGDL